MKVRVSNQSVVESAGKALQEIAQQLESLPDLGLGGRPPILDMDTKVVVLRLITHGLSLNQAAALVRCHRSTIWRTRKYDSQFDLNIRQALELRKLQPLAVLMSASGQCWRAAAELLKCLQRQEHNEQIEKRFNQLLKEKKAAAASAAREPNGSENGDVAAGSPRFAAAASPSHQKRGIAHRNGESRARSS